MAARGDRQLALLRGINVGKNKQVPMAELRELLEGLGYGDVATHLRSGNALYTTRTAPTTAAAEIERAIAGRFGFEVAVVVRTAAEIADVLARDPVGDAATDGSRYLVAFLAEKPSAAARRELEQADVAPDALHVSGREVYMWCPNGLMDSRASAALGAVRPRLLATARNWNTVSKLAEMLAD